MPAVGEPASPANLDSRSARLREVPERILRALLLWLSRRRVLGRLATRTRLTRPFVARFVAGETLADALDSLHRMHRAGFLTTVDVLGEEVDAPPRAGAAAERYVETLDALAAEGLDANVSLKLSQMGLRIDDRLCRSNVERVVERARALDGFVRFDMEDHTANDATLELVRALRMDAESERGDVGVVIQAALRRSPADVERLIAEGTRVRLCKGAYREPAHVAYATKAEVDASFARLMDRLLRAGRYPALATHDPRLIRRAIALAEREGISPDRFEFQMLYGVRRDLQDRLVAQGWRVRVYVPYGGDWYPYFMRRLAERPANVAFVLRSVLREGRGASARR
jgi:proline dehydrogenase